MRNSLRTLVVGLMVVAMSFHPAAAWRYFHDGCGDCGSYGPVYYEPVHSGCCGEVVVQDDGCCGAPCGDCGACDGCDACGEAVMESAPGEQLPETAPMPPAEEAPMPTTPPQEPVTVEQPVETAPVPIEPVPPAEEPAEEPDSLFNGTEEAAPPATETPATPPPAEETDDLFGEPAESTPPAESQPAEEPAEQPAEESLDLFGEPADTDGEMPAEEPPAEEQPAGEQPEQPAEETPAEEPPAEEEKPAEEEDDIFGASRGIMREPGGLASEVMRTWVDNTGNFSTRGRLVQFLDGHVRLMKDNGRTTTVPLYRLSTSDLEFVHRQASAQQADAFQTAQSPIAMPGLAN